MSLLVLSDMGSLIFFGVLDWKLIERGMLKCFILIFLSNYVCDIHGVEDYVIRGIEGCFY